MSEVDWSRRALESEIALSEAYGGIATRHAGFVHVRSQLVPWAGDFNRALDVRLTDLRSLDAVVEQVEGIHRRLGLDAPDRLDVAPPPLAAANWSDELARRGFRMETAIFFRAETETAQPAPGLVLRSPGPDEYFEWFADLARARGYYDDEWFGLVRPAQERFVRVFRPCWLEEHGELVAWTYRAALGGYARLFEVEVANQARGRGIGRLLLNAVRSECASIGREHVLLQSGERLRGFYKGSGFAECARNSILRRS
jgi:ribosomal protein S18 acetylase RimI-like enzyme